ncbi:MAG TPA: glycosyltransferase family 2 protein [Candidatus Moranbacteria bacterium]|nr:glycosyltransferase family 2 protein [Candidatus Moranbacteria bacterium]
MNHPKPSLSIVIPHYRNEQYLGKCLDSLFKVFAQENIQLIVVDIAPLKNTTLSEKVELILMEKNAGFGAACNLGAMAAKAPFILFLNPDTELPHSPFTKILHAFAANEIGIIGLDLKLPSGKKQPFANGEFPTILNIIKTNFFGEKSREACDWVSGAALAIRKDLFDSLGGFDTDFFLYFEDVDLCRRALKAGKKTFLLPETEVIHFGGTSSESTYLQKKHYYESQFRYFAKHHGQTAAWLIKILRLLTHPLPR